MTTKGAKPLDPTPKSTGHGHPLFDPPDASKPDTRDISWVQVVRGGVHYPKNFTADELQSLEDVHAIFGGGNFEFIGRDQKSARITARQSRRIEGKPKAMPNEEPAPTPASLTPSTSPTEDKWFGLITGVILPFGLKYLADRSDEQRRREEREAEERRRSDERQTQMMLTFAQNSNQQTAQMMGQFTALTTGVIQGAQHAPQNLDAKTYLEIYKKGGEEMKAAIEKVAAESKDGESVKEFLGGAQIFFATEAEKAAAEREKAMLERTKYEAYLRGAAPYPGMPMPQAMPHAFPGMPMPQAMPHAFPGMPMPQAMPHAPAGAPPHSPPSAPGGPGPGTQGPPS